MNLLTTHDFRSGQALDVKPLDYATTADWFLDLLSGAVERGVYIHIGCRADRIYDILEVSVIKIGSAHTPSFYELSHLSREESAALMREYDEYRRN